MLTSKTNPYKLSLWVLEFSGDKLKQLNITHKREFITFFYKQTIINYLMLGKKQINESHTGDPSVKKIIYTHPAGPQE